jgi:tetratricopeptide (TPR) repeat protein
MNSSESQSTLASDPSRRADERAVRRMSSGRATPKPMARSAWITLAVLGPAALFLGWRVLTLGLADMWVDSDPATALYWRPDDPKALFDAADDAFAKFQFKEAKSLSLRTIANYPLDGRAYRELGGASEFFGDRTSAKRLFEVAQRLAPRDLAARSELTEYELEAGQVPQAMHQVDTLLRLEPNLMPDLLPRLGALSRNPDVLASLGEILQARPPWRLYFLAILAASGEDPVAVDRVADPTRYAIDRANQEAIDRVFAIRGGDDPIPMHPPQTELDAVSEDADEVTGFTEADLLINRQVADGRWSDAYQTWVGTLSKAEQTTLAGIYDGSFLFPPSTKEVEWLGLTAKSFGWQVPDQGTGFDILMAPRTQFSNNNVLQIKFDGLPLDYRPVKQLLVLPPGSYRLSGTGQAEAMSSQYGVQWVVACAEGEQEVLGKSMAFAGDIPAEPFQVDFDVPAGDSSDTVCRGQWLSLNVGAGIFAGEPLQGDAVFENLQITRLAPQTAAQIDRREPNSAPTAGRADQTPGETVH